MTSKLAPQLASASTQGYIGEINSSFARKPGFFLSPMTNDMLGKTDKLMTGSSSLHLKTQSDRDPESIFSTETSVFWRALTPSYREKDGSPTFIQPLGFYSDWLEAQSSIAMIKTSMLGGLKIEIGGGRGEIKNHGIGKIHREIHQAVDQPVGPIDYSTQKETSTFSTHFGLTLLAPILGGDAVNLETAASAGQNTNPFFMENYGSFIMYIKLSENFGFSLERRVIHINKSSVYTNVRQKRYETTLVLKFGKHFFPSLKYVSPYLRGDNQGQIYTDLVNWNFEF